MSGRADLEHMLHLTDKNEIAANIKEIESLAFQNLRLIEQYKASNLVSEQKTITYKVIKQIMRNLQIQELIL